MMRLSDLTIGTVATVAAIDPGAEPATLARLTTLGLVVGTPIAVERRLPMSGPIVLRFGGAVFALEHATANLISVHNTVPSQQESL